MRRPEYGAGWYRTTESGKRPRDPDAAISLYTQPERKIFPKGSANNILIPVLVWLSDSVCLSLALLCSPLAICEPARGLLKASQPPSAAPSPPYCSGQQTESAVRRSCSQLPRRCRPSEP
eukprot:3384381-Rhodomonas_salina.1